MNTPAHLLIGSALLGQARLGKANANAVLSGALLGSLLPDLSLYIMASICIFLLDIPAPVVFDELYFSDEWQSVFAVDNSLIIWSGVLAVAFYLRKPWFMALAGAALLHLVSDFALHHDDARSHLWPLTHWRFESPISYWDVNHHAIWVAPVEGLLSLLAVIYLWRVHASRWLRVLFALLLAMELMVIRSWLLFF